MSKYKEIDIICPNCSRPVNSRMSFCLECGDLLDHRRMPAPRSRRRRSSAMSDIIKSALLVMALALFGIFVITVYESIKSYQTDGVNAIKKARAYALSGEDENAINLLSRAIDEDKSGKFHSEMLALLDQCLYERGLKLAQAGHYHDAVTCFSRVSPGYQNKEEVDKLIAEYSDKALPLEFSQVTGTVPGSDSSAAASLIPALAGHAMSRLDKTALESVPQVADKRLQPGKNLSTKSEGVIPLAPASNVSTMPAAAPLPPRVAPQSSNRASMPLAVPASIPGSIPAAMPTSSVPMAPPVALINGKKGDSQVDSIARYNELLARYFSKNSSDTRNANEPPSYDEWVSNGKSDF
ncbi:MAG: hypothetical protein IPO31_05430 [Candidatus Obscuribacter sp.]|nr:hypothetical protein [Candidatus Obscuribacter sp.]